MYQQNENPNNLLSSVKFAHSSPPLRLVNPPCLITYRHMRFLLMDAPSESTLPLYLKEMLRTHVTDLVRVCEPTYSREIVEETGIRVHEWHFPDGAAPPANILHHWLALINQVFADSTSDYSSDDSSDEESKTKCRPTIAVHCIAGLGRAPVLIAIALIENGMDPFDAVMFIRKKRRGAINQMQLKFLETYYQNMSKRSRAKCSII